jgi:hypothetical protein
MEKVVDGANLLLESALQLLLSSQRPATLLMITNAEVDYI